MEKRGSQRRRYRSKVEGIVIKSLPNNCWHVKWTAIQKTCDLRVSDAKLYCKGPIVSNENLDTHFNIADHFESVTRSVRVFDWYAENRRRTVHTSNTKLVDETMFAFRPQMHKDGNLPHLSYVQQKPENLGVEVKSCAALRPRVFLSLEIQRSKDDLNGREFLEEAQAKKTSACTMRLLDKACQRSEYDDDTTALEEPSTCSVINADAGRDLVIGDSWFGSVATTDCLLNKMRYGKDSILQVKTAHSLFPKKYIESVTKDWPGGSHIVLKTEFKGKTMYAVGYKYCSKKTLLFIFNKGAAGTEPGVPYRATVLCG